MRSPAFRPIDLPGRSRRRVLVVDDSAIARAALSRLLVAAGRFDVATAADAPAALRLLGDAPVDAILLDLDMPGTSGIDALPALIRASGGAPVLIVSGIAARGAAVTVAALTRGAADAMVKPVAGLGAAFAQDLVARIDLLIGQRALAADAIAAQPVALPPFEAIALGASTGGIHALAAFLGALPDTLRQPILVTQHLPASFVPFLAEQLGRSARRPARVGMDGEPVGAGDLLIAPGDAHLGVEATTRGVFVRLSNRAAPTGNLPAVDVMFGAASAIWGERLLAVVLSGMGRDGCVGAREVVDAGGTVIVQDRDTSVVWGMPGSVADAGLARAVLPPHALGTSAAAAS